jgi:outer membrane immunogenic protein
MKSLVVAAVAVFAFASNGPAGAADIPRAPAYKTPVAPPVFSWTGCYVGGHVGGTRNDSELVAQPTGLFAPAVVAAGTFSYNFDDSHVTAGVQYGCNRQFGNWVLGLDSSYSWSGIDETITAAHPATGALPAYTETLTQEVRWFSTTRGRIGYAWDRWMIFAAGGLATGRIESTYFSPPSGGFSYAGSRAKTRYGWTAGGGVEYALNQNWFLRGEYLYVDLGDYSYTAFQTPPVPAGFTWGVNVDTKFHVARVALSYRFTNAGSFIEWGLGGFR